MIIIHGKRKGLLAEVSWEKLWAHSLRTPSLKPMTNVCCWDIYCPIFETNRKPEQRL